MTAPRTCLQCAYKEIQQLPPPNLGKVMICRRFPPQAIVQQVGNQMNMTSTHPIVGPQTWCHEFKSAEPAPMLIA